jgi:signal transduction histidine kinase
MENKIPDDVKKNIPPHLKASESYSIRLSDFIRANSDKIIAQWENFARTLVPASTDMTPLALRNHIKEILAFIAEDMDTAQTGPEQERKSRGEGNSPAPPGEVIASPAETHAALRLAGGFNQDQMVSEYRALRASIIRLWNAEHPEMKSQDVLDLTRFNESIDQELTESIKLYTKKLDHSRNMFLGILGHDLRNPVGAILMSAQLQLRLGEQNDKQKMLSTQIVASAERTLEIISHLLDMTRARFGTGLPVVRSPMDFGFVSNQMVDEIRANHPKREITLEISGDMEGEWDKARIGQVFSNLLSNAIQYGFRGTPINVTVRGEPDEIILSVHNEGIPIPPDRIGGIFSALTRDTEKGSEETTGSMNLGLGLYITREIVSAHGGKIGVTSTEQGGTTFRATFPRHNNIQDKNQNSVAEAGALRH